MDGRTPSFPVLYYLLELLKLISIESVMPSNHLLLCHPLLLLPLIFPSIKVFSNELGLRSLLNYIMCLAAVGLGFFFKCLFI